MKKQEFIIKEKEFSHVGKLIIVGSSKGIVLRKEDLEAAEVNVGDAIMMMWKPIKKDDVQSKTQQE